MSSAVGSTTTLAVATTFSFIKTIVFYLSLAVWTVFWAMLMILFIYPFRFKLRHRIFVKTWAMVSVYLCRLICGIRWEVKGSENIPNTPCVIISNHQSTWETLYLQTLLTPQTQVIKQELLKIPFFGWAFKKIKPIAINRKDARQALQQVREQGKAALEHNVWVLIFPEGTRTPPGEPGKFSRGGAGLAKAADVDILPIAHNAGVFWPNDSWLKRPGTIQVEIGPVINTETLSVAEVNDATRNWIAEALNNMN
ncbi:1-acyl-sn-glycerol-3-phosphate acyltransferase [Endozoicomonas sp. SCSIO W0465]|uniref:lysophospholipid acyltransferase family protein n=1 Tax=Endozoicomonas sp. SCSIO W0465 TaxID=2918516 RepID=UPI002075DA53|nr:lysophospholipid acyltransferase family protein [Endozoicomonas sp. SCSIO W0465]USE36677.1 1-acyl-sn-glycerol-3-phosphate acyltransferase [Endozoicomonas sp. SCSIO W0465]